MGDAAADADADADAIDTVCTVPDDMVDMVDMIGMMVPGGETRSDEGT